MELKGAVSNIEEIPEEHRKHYSKNEDTGLFIADFTPLLNAYERQKEEAKNLKSKTEELSNKFSQVDVERYNRLVELEKNLEADKAKRAEDDARKRGDFEKLEKTMREAHEAEKAALRKQLEEEGRRNDQILRQSFENHLEAELRKVFADSKVAKPHFIEHEVKGRVKVVKDENGNYTYKVLNRDGSEASPKYTADGVKAPGLFDLVSEYKADEKWADAFQPTGLNGPALTGKVAPSISDPDSIKLSVLQQMSGEAYKDAYAKIQSGKLKLVKDI